MLRPLGYVNVLAMIPAALTSPNIPSVLGPEINVKPALAPALPLALYKICVLLPGTVKLPVMLPAKLPTK